MTLESLLPWLPLLNILILPMGGWVIRALRKDLASAADLQEQAKEIQALNQRVALVERDMSHLPDDNDFEGLRKWMAEIAAETRSSSTQMETMVRTVVRIEDYLLNRK